MKVIKKRKDYLYKIMLKNDECVLIDNDEKERLLTEISEGAMFVGIYEYGDFNNEIIVNVDYIVMIRIVEVEIEEKEVEMEEFECKN